ncbi:acyl carrier protein [Streptomyces sp. SPB074]|uniref:acyl carrier protein n=1 Tax=Streptomyces sp. (strain SPB074) TaxID=465543 RepID=UPI00017F11EE|nr:phosphopantetheine-binding protein [Streptomyces sp. SPB074]EDY42530.1 oxytetracycline polyketide synthase acyl carrier protein (ACP) [Streptomyces sp. SPB074]
MSVFALDDLFTIMRECAGEEESAELTAAAARQEFTELGYDSLALLEALSRVERAYHVELPEETLAEALTPAAFVAAVNAQLVSPTPAMESAE